MKDIFVIYLRLIRELWSISIDFYSVFDKRKLTYPSVLILNFIGVFFMVFSSKDGLLLFPLGSLMVFFSFKLRKIKRLWL